jgi:uncharacterized pyridoxamine 5'-phosphate oxidase family protein
MELTFAEAAEKFRTTLAEAKSWVLATSFENQVGARTISVVCAGQAILFQTDKLSLKCRHMAKNPQVALCSNNCSIEETG